MPENPSVATHIDRLHLTPPTRDALEKAGLMTLGDILAKTEQQLIDVIGEISYWEIVDDILAPHNLACKREPPANENSPED